MHKEFKATDPETGIVRWEQLSLGTSTFQQALPGLLLGVILSYWARPLCRAAAASSSSPSSLPHGGRGGCAAAPISEMQQDLTP